MENEKWGLDHDSNGAIKTILIVWNELLHTCNGAIKTKGKMHSTVVIINLTKLTISPNNGRMGWVLFCHRNNTKVTPQHQKTVN